MNKPKPSVLTSICRAVKFVGTNPSRQRYLDQHYKGMRRWHKAKTELVAQSFPNIKGELSCGRTGIHIYGFWYTVLYRERSINHEKAATDPWKSRFWLHTITIKAESSNMADEQKLDYTLLALFMNEKNNRKKSLRNLSLILYSNSATDSS